MNFSEAPEPALRDLQAAPIDAQWLPLMLPSGTWLRPCPFSHGFSQILTCSCFYEFDPKCEAPCLISAPRHADAKAIFSTVIDAE
ncbi:hypothetical protein NPIL_271911 [Nephila pilipes]|uniref:Uncharacterized protein n=1 Tax=Nephila pilipes TaxID=299642 RepID=A0A8X6P5P8_NEPPI|nr:hypothetical protein NPIL_271911 [Nephila pilipes]